MVNQLRKPTDYGKDKCDLGNIGKICVLFMVVIWIFGGLVVDFGDFRNQFQERQAQIKFKDWRSADLGKEQKISSGSLGYWYAIGNDEVPRKLNRVRELRSHGGEIGEMRFLVFIISVSIIEARDHSIKDEWIIIKDSLNGITEMEEYSIKEGVESFMSSYLTLAKSIQFSRKILKSDLSGSRMSQAHQMINGGSSKRKDTLAPRLRITKVEERVAGADLGMGRFQFDFDTEEDIQAVLAMEPLHFDGWMVPLVRWEPIMDSNYPSEITFWVRMMGVPLHFWAEPTFRSIGQAIGTVKQVDLDGGRAQIIIDGFRPIVFETTVEFHSGEETTVILRYERLYGYCRECFSLCHESSRCPTLLPKRERRDEMRFTEEKPDGGAKSYKGALVGHGASVKEGTENTNVGSDKDSPPQQHSAMKVRKGLLFEENSMSMEDLVTRRNQVPAVGCEKEATTAPREETQAVEGGGGGEVQINDDDLEQDGLCMVLHRRRRGS
ncbi:unnamed protein product [Thlaspi arvense]|uniref:Zinc knuckle CX2CX4HX4C domain-containing protein n=1 Tax=Thlaspi arvense TaxID=13288 RepID=A0AAU9RWA1_THLAR|nr:unnamed protein product [Thlaspi arvense]